MSQAHRESRRARFRARLVVESLEGRALATTGLTGAAAASASASEPPEIVRKQLITSGGEAIGIALTFSGPLDPTRAQNVRNFRVANISPDHDFSWSTLLFPLPIKSGNSGKVALKTAEYSASTNTVILIPKQPLNASKLYQVTSRRSLVPVKLHDKAGHPKPLIGLAGLTRDGRIFVSVNRTSTAPQTLKPQGR